MTKKHSTSALTKEDHQKQDKIYSENHEYDYLIIGTGNSALTVGALLANAGKKVCMLEAHDVPGGYAHTFKMGDFNFCAQVHYIWGCGEGGKFNAFLKQIGLDKDITFELYDPEGYDQTIMPDGKRVKIPYGWDKLVENIEAAFPGQRKPMGNFVKIMEAISTEMGQLPNKEQWWRYATALMRIKNLVKYRNSTLQDVFDECGLSKEAQAVLSANVADFMLPPNELSIFPYVGLLSGYNTGAYYPTKHYKYYIDRIAQSITDHEGCHIYYEMPVEKINVQGDRVTQVKTKDGKVFTADTIICNMDPQKASEMIGWNHFPSTNQKKLKYDYSVSGMMIYLGLKDIDLSKYGFGKHNTWHLPQWDMNRMWADQLSGNFEKPWIFISTPTLHSSKPGIAPEGHHIMEVGTVTDYRSWRELHDSNYVEYTKKKLALADRLIDMVEEHHVPDLRKHIVLKVVGTSTTNEDYTFAPYGNSYGSSMTPKQMGLGRLKANTPFVNFYWCNASSGYAGMYGTLHTGMKLYMDLTGDRFWNRSQAPTNDELIAQLQQ